MAKIPLDKYYTPDNLAKYCIEKTKEIIGTDNITEFLEPSAGSGVFLKYLDKPYLAYDISPEGKNIEQADYLKLDLEYKKGRCVIGNPPYGTRNTLSVKFFKKSIQLGDYIAFILPSSQYNNNNQMYEFDLIYSKLIDNKDFVDLDKRISLTFNIYKRPQNNIFNKKPTYKLKNVLIKEARKGSKNSVTSDYDIGICSFGWSVGKEPEYVGQYANEFYFYIKNEFKEQIVTLIKNTNWREVAKNMTGVEKINQWQAYKYIKEQIPEIE